ncbi:hypothetical protein [Nocardia farcinica]|uniref:hypothetical protein n=1 Tax=Nocardia farcinica TaxID=37329 RepID=UPI00245474C6|nr:hypothetical protein [Nocardia farcinica]
MPDQTPEFVSLDEYRAPVEPAARQHAEDLNASYRLSHEALAMRHARTLSALRTVWASRRRHQKRASDMLAEDFGAAESRVRELEAERDKLARLLAAESARLAELETQQPRTIQHRLGVVDALPPGSQIVDDDGVPALKVADFDPGVTDGDGYHSEWITATGMVGTYDLAMPVRVLHIPTQEGQADA